MSNPDFLYRNDEYMALMHAMQSGVKAVTEIQQGDTAAHSPKHLRTGVNASMILGSAVVKTLVEKGLITWEEFRDNEIELLKNEVKGYEQQLSDYYGGATINLA
jgi:hypothetical protein